MCGGLSASAADGRLDVVQAPLEVLVVVPELETLAEPERDRVSVFAEDPRHVTPAEAKAKHCKGRELDACLNERGRPRPRRQGGQCVTRSEFEARRELLDADRDSRFLKLVTVVRGRLRMLDWISDLISVVRLRPPGKLGDA